MRVFLFKASQASFLQALDDASITYEMLRPEPDQVMASGATAVLALTAVLAGPLAKVLVAWIKARASRKIIFTLRGNKIVHLEGYSVEQVKELLPSVEQMTAIDTRPVEQSDNSVKPDPLN